MEDGIWKVGKARLCTQCQSDMAPLYVFRFDGQMRRGVCERCGKDARLTMMYRYTMNKAGLTLTDRLDG